MRSPHPVCVSGPALIVDRLFYHFHSPQLREGSICHKTRRAICQPTETEGPHCNHMPHIHSVFCTLSPTYTAICAPVSPGLLHIHIHTRQRSTRMRRRIVERCASRSVTGQNNVAAKSNSVVPHSHTVRFHR